MADGYSASSSNQTATAASYTQDFGAGGAINFAPQAAVQGPLSTQQMVLYGAVAVVLLVLILKR